MPRKEQLEKYKQIHINIQVPELEHDKWSALGTPTKIIRNLIKEKMGSKEKILSEIAACEDIIRREQERLEQLRTILQKCELAPENEHNEHEELRQKALVNLLKREYSKWDTMNTRYALETGKFKDTRELENWVKQKQGMKEI